MLLINYDAQLKALARLKELEITRSAGYAQAKYGEMSEGGCVDSMLPSGLVYQVTVCGDDGRSYTFDREDLDLTGQLIKHLPHAADRGILELVYLTYGSLAEKARHIGISKQLLGYRRNAAVQRFSKHWVELKTGRQLAPGCGVSGRFAKVTASNDANKD